MAGADWAEARAQMVADQLERRGVRDTLVLEAMRRVPRHLFVPPERRASAYDDCALPIGQGQTISQPYMVAIMSEALGPLTGARVLEIGTGSGYQAAILAELAAEVVTIERHSGLAEAARQKLLSLGYANVTVLVADGSSGYAAGQPEGAARRPGQAGRPGRIAVSPGPRRHRAPRRFFCRVAQGRMRVRPAHRPGGVAGGPMKRLKSVVLPNVSIGFCIDLLRFLRTSFY